MHQEMAHGLKKISLKKISLKKISLKKISLKKISPDLEKKIKESIKPVSSDGHKI